MRALALHRGSVYLFGARFPAAVVILFVTTLVATLVGVVGYRNGFPLLDYVGLSPRAVGQGQVWRLVTWVFFDPSVSPLSLLFFGMMLLMFGRDLCDAWGWRRFTAVYLGIAVAAGVLTCLVALAWRTLMLANYMDTWPVIDALVVAWALSFPTRQILFNFVIPLSGRALVWITVGLTLFFAVLSGLAGFVPHLAALAAIFAYLRGVPLLRHQWLGSQLRRAQGPSRRRPAHLRPVDEPDEKPRWYH